MKTDKEYPATHSMHTAWYFVDEEDNVALFDIDDNGPVPVGLPADQFVNDLCFEEVESGEGMEKHYNFSDEQVKVMLESLKEVDLKSDVGWTYGGIFVINTAKRDQFFSYLRKARTEYVNSKHFYPNSGGFIPICLSESMGVYSLDLCAYSYGNGLNNPHARYLVENEILLRAYFVYFLMDYDEDDENGSEDPNSCCPYYLYANDWDSSIPHKKMSQPTVPMKLEQLPPKLREKAYRLKLRFEDTDEIQLAEHYFCYQSSQHDLVTPEGTYYCQIRLPSKEYVFVLNEALTIKKEEELQLHTPEERVAYLQRFPRTLNEQQVNELKALPENKDFFDLRDFCGQTNDNESNI